MQGKFFKDQEPALLKTAVNNSVLLHGDCLELMKSIPDGSIDAIITDPPYGIREKSGFCVGSPLINLVKCISEDRANGDENRLLKIGGRLVAFVPNQEGDDITADMPSEKDLASAGLAFVQMLEQPLNDSLSRWLVEYKCTS